jgi:hypothetical protein
MEKTMSDPFALWTGYIVLVGTFLVFVVHFSKFVHGEVWPVLGPLLREMRRWFR